MSEINIPRCGVRQKEGDKKVAGVGIVVFGKRGYVGYIPKGEKVPVPLEMCSVEERKKIVDIIEGVIRPQKERGKQDE